MSLCLSVKYYLAAIERDFCKNILDKTYNNFSFKTWILLKLCIYFYLMFFSDLFAIFHQFEKIYCVNTKQDFLNSCLSAKSDNSVAGNQLAIQCWLSKQRA